MCAALILSTLQWVRKLKKTCPFCLHSHAYITPCPFRVPQVCDTLIDCVWHVNFGWLSTNNPTWLQYVSANIFIFLAFSWSSILVFVCRLFLGGAQRHEVCDPLINCVLACSFRVAINEQFDMTTASKFEYLQFFCLLSLLILCLWCVTLYLLVLRYATHWFLVFGMWISGGYQRTIRHYYSK